MTQEMLSTQEKNGCQEFKKRVSQEFGKRVTLFKIFGSKVKGETWEESDIDILVLVKNLNWKEKGRIIDLSEEVNLQYDLMISPFVMRPEEFENLLHQERLIALDIEKEGMTL